MDKKPAISRRKWLKLGIAGAAGTVITAACDTPADSASTEATTGSDAACVVSPRQELGPFPPMKQLAQADHDVDLTMVDGQTEQATGEVMIVKGKVLDQACNPLAGAVVVIWQSNHHGKYHHEMDLSDYEMDPNFQGWGQAITNEKGEYQFKTIKPGLYTGRARHIHYKVSKKGYFELVTQLYFEGEEQNETDVLLNQLGHEDQQRLICAVDNTSGTPTMAFDINLQAVDQASVSAEVLAEYIGNYQFELAEDHPLRSWFLEIGVTEENITASVTSKDRQLFLQITSTPEAEVFWKKKDTFDAIAQYSSTLIFKREESGKVDSLNLVMPWYEEVLTLSANKV